MRKLYTTAHVCWSEKAKEFYENLGFECKQFDARKSGYIVAAYEITSDHVEKYRGAYVEIKDPTLDSLFEMAKKVNAIIDFDGGILLDGDGTITIYDSYME